jgi:hypothetical protein
MPQLAGRLPEPAGGGPEVKKSYAPQRPNRSAGPGHGPLDMSLALGVTGLAGGQGGTKSGCSPKWWGVRALGLESTRYYKHANGRGKVVTRFFEGQRSRTMQKLRLRACTTVPTANSLHAVSSKELKRARRVASGKKNRIRSSCLRCKKIKVKCSDVRPCERCIRDDDKAACIGILTVRIS